MIGEEEGFSMIQEIGDGTFSTVYSAYDTVQRCTVALKVPKNQAGRNLLEREANIMHRLAHCKCKL